MFLQCEGFEPLPLAPSVRSIATEVSYSVSRSFYLNEWFEHAGAEVSETAERAICILDGLPLSAVSKNTGSLFGVPIRRILVSWGYISGSLFVEMPISHRASSTSFQGRASNSQRCLEQVKGSHAHGFCHARTARQYRLNALDLGIDLSLHASFSTQYFSCQGGQVRVVCVVSQDVTMQCELLRHGGEHHHVLSLTADGRILDACVYEPVQ